ncbi:MAG: porin family protein [Hoeflea sp.]|uniref:outer membrane protein n=1 Tax=Hoeflea sp. TaxID=1940281 RepID=UPI001DD7C847|nr:porin family protein [Hoeflea sp.]MBU4530754.1 porin family protein [Alphaproteobacteria bacterium]MBU4544753.1 porin family protein [Alphaproteobacteria bacterium]MBU4549309.1 porin family protein [Alphaproteobacteria bacterium]MBV1726348.1 porin family protein [Hoeflea sp.]MBV1761690.1 porin family protein [Hoeflea sp.]
MFTRIAVTSCIAALAGLAASAQAADLDEVIYAPELPMTQPVEIGSGWYLRGDLGYSLETRGAATNYSIFTPGPTYTGAAYNSSSLDSDWSGSLGVGYNFTDYLRGDLTFDYTDGTFSGARSSAGLCPAGGPVGTGCASTDSQGFKQYGIMANAYVDLGTFSGFTPYLGAGAGMTKVVWGTLNTANNCTGVACVAPAAATANPGQEDWRFTYALMAGMSYDLTKNMKVDLGYKYSKINDGAQHGHNAFDTAAGATGTKVSDNGFEKHEVRVGLRYSLW